MAASSGRPPVGGRPRPAVRDRLEPVLAIVKGLVEAHGGSVWVRSEAGHGTTFLFELPAVKESGTPIASAERHA